MKKLRREVAEPWEWRKLPPTWVVIVTGWLVACAVIKVLVVALAFAMEICGVGNIPLSRGMINDYAVGQRMRAPAHSDPVAKNLRGRVVPMYSMDPAELVVVTDRKHPLWDERVRKPVSEEMVESIMQYGVRTPIEVRRDGPRLEVTEGRQRTRAAVEANRRLAAEGRPKKRVLVVIISGQDRDFIGASTTANEIRSGDGVLVKAAKAHRMRFLYSYTLKEIAITFGVDEATIENWLKLADLHRDVRALVSQGKLKYTVAIRLAALPRDQQVPKLRELLATRATNANAVRAVRGGKLERVCPPSRQQLRRMADYFLRQDGFLNGEKANDVYSVVSWILGRISTEELLSVLSSSEAALIGDAVRSVAAKAAR